MNGRELPPGRWYWYLGLKSVFLDRPHTLVVVGLGERSTTALVQNIDMCESTLCLALWRQVPISLSWPYTVRNRIPSGH